jgi:hypothetical protein
MGVIGTTRHISNHQENGRCVLDGRLAQLDREVSGRQARVFRMEVTALHATLNFLIAPGKAGE